MQVFRTSLPSQERQEVCCALATVNFSFSFWYILGDDSPTSAQEALKTLLNTSPDGLWTLLEATGLWESMTQDVTQSLNSEVANRCPPNVPFWPCGVWKAEENSGMPVPALASLCPPGFQALPQPLCFQTDWMSPSPDPCKRIPAALLVVRTCPHTNAMTIKPHYHREGTEHGRSHPEIGRWRHNLTYPVAMSWKAMQFNKMSFTSNAY